MMRRREAEGSIYTGKCQGPKQWPILPHHSIRHNVSFAVWVLNERLDCKSMEIK